MARKEPMFELFNIRESPDPFATPVTCPADTKRGTQPLGRFLFDPVNRKFLRADGKWTSSQAEAMNFADIHAVARACSKYRVQRGEVLLRSTENVEFRLPLRAERK